MAAHPKHLLFASTEDRQGQADIWSYWWEPEDSKREKLESMLCLFPPFCQANTLRSSWKICVNVCVFGQPNNYASFLTELPEEAEQKTWVILTPAG